MHINVLELKAILFGLRSFLNEESSKHIRIKTDNSSAVSYINNFGGVKSIQCHSIAKDIWVWAIERKNFLSAEHIPGSKNILADKASRIFDENTEWEISSSVYSYLLEKFGPFDIDLFASRLNTKNATYASWKPDPNAVTIDAFSASWSQFSNLYAFPPFSIIMKYLQKISADSATGLLIVPVWPTQPWFPKIMRMLIDAPVVLPQNILSLPFKTTSSRLPSVFI